MTEKSIFLITAERVHEDNQSLIANLIRDYDYLGEKLQQNKISIEDILKKTMDFSVAIPSWGVGTGGTRFGRFPGIGEPRNVFEKIEDCGTIHQLAQLTASVSLHIPWDQPSDAVELLEYTKDSGLYFDAINSNTFQDQKGQNFSYKYGSLTHTDKRVRQQAIVHNIECIELGKILGSKAITIWIADGGNFPGQLHFAKALDRYVDSLKQIYQALPEDWQVFLEHKMYEPAFYSTVINDWGTSYWAASQLGERAFCLVDLGHHAPNTNIEMIVSRLIQFGKLAGFHFNDSKYGDDDLDSGSIQPFQLFLVFNELTDAEYRGVLSPKPAHMLDQSHNVTDPVEALMSSAMEVGTAYVKSLLVDREKLSEYQDQNDPLMALRTLKNAYDLNVSAILAMARYKKGGAIEPISCFRQSGYRLRKAEERPAEHSFKGGII